MGDKSSATLVRVLRKWSAFLWIASLKEKKLNHSKKYVLLKNVSQGERNTENMPFVLSFLLSSLRSESRFDKKLIRAHLWVPDGTPVSWPLWQPFINHAVPVEKNKHRSNCLSKLYIHLCIMNLQLFTDIVDIKNTVYISAKGDMCRIPT